LRYPIHFTIVLLAFLFSIAPIHLIADTLNIQSNATLVTSMIVMQIICGYALFSSYNSTQSKSLKLLWQYFLLAILGSFITSIAHLFSPTSILTKDFLSLFSYFFIILAIETNPHLNKAPANKYVGGRVPSIFFCVFTFAYFVVLPYEFSEKSYQTYLPSLIFHVLISALVAIRVLCCLAHCRILFWRRIYSAIFIGSLLLLTDNLLSFASLRSLITYNDYWRSLLTLLPYSFLILAAFFSIKESKPTISPAYFIHSELYILILTITFCLFHFLGLELQLFYIATSFWQAFIVITWLTIATLFIAFIVNKKRKAYEWQKHKNVEVTDENTSIKSLNEQLNNALIYSENKAIVHASSNAILTCTTKGKVLSANPAAIQIFQLLETELVDSKVKKLFSPNDKMHYFFDFDSNVFSLQRQEKGLSIECKAIRSDNSEFPVQAELQWAQRHESPLIVITFINLTARKLAEKQALELKDKFIANISHEFRTPLTIINGVLDRYLKLSTTSKENLELTTAKRNGLRLVRMVEQLLELSRLNDNPKLSLSTFRLATLMAMPGDSFYRLAQQSNLTFDIKIPDNLWLECDAQAFEKIIFNLLANAIKYTPKGGAIKVNAYQEKDTIILDIIDTGIGITKESQAKIFERFQRADDQKNQAIFGVGIGLSLVNELVKAHHWRISLISEYNQGSKFSLSIPCAQPIENETSLPHSVSEDELSSLLVEQQHQNMSVAAKDQQVVLIIEDNIDMQSHIKQVVEQAHHCLLATSGELGLSIAQEYMPDLIICDIMLTGIDGFEVLQQLKAHELTCHIPIILLTARSDLDSRLQGLNLQADDYLSKPFNQQELLIRIENLIEGRKQLQQTHIERFKQQQTSDRKEASHENAARLTSDTNKIESIDEIFLEKLEVIIAKMYTEPDLGIQHLADNMAMSERQLQRKMKVILGTTPNNFIKEFRLKKAQELLKSGAQIGRIALDVGFSSQTYFGRCFKESFNCTPKQYQQRLDKE